MIWRTLRRLDTVVHETVGKATETVIHFICLALLILASSCALFVEWLHDRRWLGPITVGALGGILTYRILMHFLP